MADDDDDYALNASKPSRKLNLGSGPCLLAYCPQPVAKLLVTFVAYVVVVAARRAPLGAVNAGILLSAAPANWLLALRDN